MFGAPRSEAARGFSGGRGRQSRELALVFFDFPPRQGAHADPNGARGAKRRLLIATLLTPRPDEKASALHSKAFLVFVLLDGARADITSFRLVLKENGVVRRDEAFR